MVFTPAQNEALRAPLDGKNVKKKPGAGQYSYIEAWHAIAEANRIFGFDGWCSQTDVKCIGEPREVDGKWRVAYMAKVTITVFAEDAHISRDGVGYGSGIDRDIGSAHESALKEAESDARKRALMTFGNPFGLALYDKEQREVTDSPPTPKPVPVQAPIKAGTPTEWANKFCDLANAAQSSSVLASLHTTNKEWIYKLTTELQDKCTHAYEKRMHFLSQAPARAAE